MKSFPIIRNSLASSDEMNGIKLSFDTYFLRFLIKNAKRINDGHIAYTAYLINIFNRVEPKWKYVK
ncbi:hypothetical protein W03_00640 [Nitrosomonas sp. PY1]|nr:hypothetical protein W03_00640 [Nitrosomonas sp. PY1]